MEQYVYLIGQSSEHCFT